MQNLINLVQNDTGPDLTVMLYDTASNSPIDVSGATVVRLHFRLEGAVPVTTIIGSKPSGGTDGVVSFPWGVGDLAVAGAYEGEVEITFATGKIQTVPDKIRFWLREQIG
jgi:hypothetical protein